MSEFVKFEQISVKVLDENGNIYKDCGVINCEGYEISLVGPTWVLKCTTGPREKQTIVFEETIMFDQDFQIEIVK
jgi:hypothetical protein